MKTPKKLYLVVSPIAILPGRFTTKREAEISRSQYGAMRRRYAILTYVLQPAKKRKAKR